jgi:hypothetical protein
MCRGHGHEAEAHACCAGVRLTLGDVYRTHNLTIRQEDARVPRPVMWVQVRVADWYARLCQAGPTALCIEGRIYQMTDRRTLLSSRPTGLDGHFTLTVHL